MLWKKIFAFEIKVYHGQYERLNDSQLKMIAGFQFKLILEEIKKTVRTLSEQKYNQKVSQE